MFSPSQISKVIDEWSFRQDGTKPVTCTDVTCPKCGRGITFRGSPGFCSRRGEVHMCSTFWGGYKALMMECWDPSDPGSLGPPPTNKETLKLLGMTIFPFDCEDPCSDEVARAWPESKILGDSLISA